MGYTHYWTFKAPDTIKGKHIKIESDYQLAVRQCQRLVKAYNKEIKAIDPKHPARLAGYSVHTKVNDYLGLEFNGTGDAGHEMFTLRDHWSKNEPMNFCKTAGKAYDVCVTACLIVLHHYMGSDLIEVTSDGDASEWEEGLALAKRILKMNLSIPETITSGVDEELLTENLAKRGISWV